MSYLVDNLKLSPVNYLSITKADLKQFVIDNPILPEGQIVVIYDPSFRSVSVAVVGDGSTLTRDLPVISWKTTLEMGWFIKNSKSISLFYITDKLYN